MAWPLRRIAFALHLWTGIAAGLLLAVLGVSGSALVYRDALDRALAPGLFRVAPGPRADLDHDVSDVRLANPGWRITSIEMRGPADAWTMRLAPVLPGRPARALFVNPYTGAVLGERTPGQGFMAWLGRLHNTLLLGHTGELIEGVLGGLLMMMIATGVGLWWPRRRALRGLRRWHGWAGAWLALPLAAQAFTGAVLAFGLPAAGLVVVLLGGSRAELGQVFQSPPLEAVSGSWVPAPLQADVDAVHRHYPDTVYVLLSLPNVDSDQVRVYAKRRGDEQRGSFVQMRFSLYSGQLVSEYDSRHASLALRTLFWLDAVHFGTAGGAWSRVAWVLVGLSPGLLFGSGLWMWVRRLCAARS